MAATASGRGWGGASRDAARGCRRTGAARFGAVGFCWQEWPGGTLPPPVGIAQMNWGSQTHVRAAGIDPAGMKATALVLSDGNQKFAMVDVDRISSAGLEPAIAAAAKRTGIPEAHIRIGATHTHAGVAVSPAKGPPGLDLTPLVDMAERYRLSVIDKVAGLIAEANGRLEPAHMHGGRGEGTININRRVRADGD